MASSASARWRLLRRCALTSRVPSAVSGLSGPLAGTLRTRGLVIYSRKGRAWRTSDRQPQTKQHLSTSLHSPGLYIIPPRLHELKLTPFDVARR
jgi:hypothetical protein